jgi:hypothetical protein
MPPNVIRDANGNIISGREEYDAYLLEQARAAEAARQQEAFQAGNARQDRVQTGDRSYAEQQIADPTQAGDGLVRRGITYDTNTGAAQIKYGQSLEDVMRQYYAAFGNGASGDVGGQPAGYVPPPQPTWEDSRAALDAAYGRAKEITGQNNRASLGALRNFMASTGRMGSGTEGRAAGRIIAANEDRLSNLGRDNEIGAARQKIDFVNQNYAANRGDAANVASSQFDIWNAKNRNAIDAANANRQSILQLYNASY